MEHGNYPNLPNFPQMPNMGGAAVGGVAENNEHHHQHHHHEPYDPYFGYGHYMPAMYPYPQQMVPASPILPGSGLCYPIQPYYHHHMMPYPYPAHPYYPAYQAPAYYGENHEHHANDGITGITICIQTPTQMPTQMPTQIKDFIQMFQIQHMERETADAMMA
ncbi:hypothetical protein BsIDN1_48210 [Bacillus safensis]|uniref:Uncharacterized protein n=1 Tax=Bacillus safensis TaxID=561879 RepID=A0A5S9MDL2_BACIA|nr:hypothetical protein BsIDN1_48210 [Bacillus safensis]